ncbi:MAG: acyltransferase [Xanthobacteraceae bacterium]
MALFSPIWGLGVYTVAFATAIGFVALSPYCRAISRYSSDRYAGIDGLRGYLAIGVFVTHSASIKQWQEVGTWTWPDSDFFVMVGTAPVATFFMITAFLFWEKAIRARGRVNLAWLLRSRLRRLAPLYLFAIPVFFILIGIASQWAIRTNSLSLIMDGSRWLALGMGGQPDINGVRPAWVFYPQVWTLQYEWVFYVALPALAWFWRPIPSLLIAAATAIAAKLGFLNIVVVNFTIGILTAELIELLPKVDWLKSRSVSALALGAIVACPFCGGSFYGLRQTICLAPLFISVCYGNRMFGLLANAPARLLGAISYSTYLLHAFLLHFFVLAVNKVSSVASLSPGAYWAAILVLTSVLVAICTLTFRFIEQPWITRDSQPVTPRGLPGF